MFWKKKWVGYWYGLILYEFEVEAALELETVLDVDVEAEVGVGAEFEAEIGVGMGAEQNNGQAVDAGLYDYVKVGSGFAIEFADDLLVIEEVEIEIGNEFELEAVADNWRGNE